MAILDYFNCKTCCVLFHTFLLKIVSMPEVTIYYSKTT